VSDCREYRLEARWSAAERGAPGARTRRPKTAAAEVQNPFAAVFVFGGRAYFSASGICDETS
jgi:hypothetical protein